MANKVTNTQNYSDIATAIRGKLGVQTQYLPSEMAAAISSIPSGGPDVYRYSIEDKVYGVGSSNVASYGTHQTNIILSNQISLLGVKKVRLRGKLIANSSHSSRQCTAKLSYKQWVGNTPTTVDVGSVSSGYNNSGRIDIDTTIDLETNNITELYAIVTCTSSYNNNTYPIDQYTWGGFGGVGVVIDSVPWYGLIVDYLFS